MSERHHWILAQANDWLKFAEAKNGALLVFDAAVIAATVQVVAEHPPGTPLLKLYLGSLWLFHGVSLVICLFSFLPTTEIPLLAASDRPNPNDNLIFFGAAKKYTAADYAAAVNSRYGVATPSDPEWEKDVSAQIVTNARIAVWKYTCFKVALWAAIWGLLTPVVGPVAIGILYVWGKVHRI